MDCATCGNPLGPNDKFCGTCGTPNPSFGKPQGQPEPEHPVTIAAGSPPPDTGGPSPHPGQDPDATILIGNVPAGGTPAAEQRVAADRPVAQPPAAGELSAEQRAARDRPFPGGALAKRPLHFIWITDCSGSMAVDGKIQALNNAIREAIPHMRNVAADNPNAEVLVRALKFSEGAQWHIQAPTPVDQFRWSDLTADGTTDMGLALSMVAAELRIPPMTDRALPPVLVLISDGQPTDDFAHGLRALMAQPWGVKAVRIAIAIGADADLDILQQFIGILSIRPLQANNPEALVNHIKFVSTAVLKSASSPSSQVDGTAETLLAVPVPVPAQADAAPGAGAIW